MVRVNVVASLFSAAVSLAMLVPLTSTSDAAPAKRLRGKAAQPTRVQQPQYYSSPSTAQDDSSTTIRANSLDPSGNYKGYPDWARAAFSPGPRGGR